MNNGARYFRRFRRFAPMTVLLLLCLQIALLWLQGSLLNRQRGEIALLRFEIQNLTMAINEILVADDAEFTTPANNAPSRSTSRNACLTAGRARLRAPCGYKKTVCCNLEK